MASNQTELKQLSEEIGQIKTLIDEDRKIVSSKDLQSVNLFEVSPSSLPAGPEGIPAMPIRSQVNDVTDEVLVKNKEHSMFRQNKDIVLGSSPPFQKYESYRLIWFCTVRNNYINAKPPADMGGAGEN